LGRSLHGLLYGQRNHKGRPRAKFARGRNGSAVAFYNLSTDGKADSRSLVRTSAVKSLEYPEYAVRVLGVDTDSIVPDGDLALAVAQYRLPAIVLPVRSDSRDFHQGLLFFDVEF